MTATQVAIETPLSAAAATEHLRRALDAHRLDRFIGARVTLRGTVRGQDVELFRRGGPRRGSYLRFKGRLVDREDGAVLEGHLVRSRNPARWVAVFLVVCAVVLVVVSVTDRRGVESASGIIGGVCAAFIGMGIWLIASRYWNANIQAEGEVLLQEIGEILSTHHARVSASG